jgi:hypothetical protein
LTPTGGTDWQNWQLFSTQTIMSTGVYLWNSTTGALYLWQSLRFADNGDGTGTLCYQQYHIAKNWNVGAQFTTVETSGFTGDGIPDLWTVTPAGHRSASPMPMDPPRRGGAAAGGPATRRAMTASATEPRERITSRSL